MHKGDCYDPVVLGSQQLSAGLKVPSEPGSRGSSTRPGARRVGYAARWGRMESLEPEPALTDEAASASTAIAPSIEAPKLPSFPG